MRKLYLPSIEQKEEAKHGEAFFPVQRYITRVAADYPSVTTHWHGEAELTLITEGDCTYQIDLVNYEVKKGDILFVPPLFLHSISRGTSEEMISETYVFHLNFLGANSTDICATRYLAPMMRQEFAMPCVISPAHPMYARIRKQFDEIAEVYTSQIVGYELEIKSLLLKTIFLLLPYSKRVDVSDAGTPSDKLKIVLDYVERHYEENITVSQLAKLCYFSDYYFMRFFKKHMNMTCIEYINNLRLEKAVELFEHGSTTITEVAMSVGFRNLSYFHRAFRKKYGMTPKEFMKSM